MRHVLVRRSAHPQLIPGPFSQSWFCAPVTNPPNSRKPANIPGVPREGLGTLEIKAESVRAVVCATRDLIEDSSFNVESWLTQKLSDAFRRTIERSLLTGDDVGKPLGLLNPDGGVPICETSPLTPAGAFSWQDLNEAEPTHFGPAALNSTPPHGAAIDVSRRCRPRRWQGANRCERCDDVL
jgi:hypothetical protein